MKLKLHQFLSKTGKFNLKRDIFTAVRSGKVKIGKKVVDNPDYYLDEKKSNVYLDDKLIIMKKGKVYLVLNKPTGYVSGKLTRSQAGKKSLFRLIKMDEERKATLFCLGRLDENSSGLIIISNDGEFCNKVMKSQTKRTYKIKLDKELDDKDLEKIKEGVIIELEEYGKITKHKTRVSDIKKLKLKNAYSISLIEGKKREIRRIMESLGSKVVSLQRISIGGLSLSDLRLGKYIFFEDREDIEKRIFK